MRFLPIDRGFAQVCFGKSSLRFFDLESHSSALPRKASTIYTVLKSRKFG